MGDFSSNHFSVSSYVLSLISALCMSFRRMMLRVLTVGPIPKHIAFIMDGNRRFADRSGLERSRGHLVGYDRLLITLENCMKLGVQYVTVYAFSIDNFSRAREEVDSLMRLMEEKLDVLVREGSLLNEYGVKVQVLGDLDLLPMHVRTAAERAMAATKENGTFVLNICVSYTSTAEIVHAIQEVRDDVLIMAAADSKAAACTQFSVDDQPHSNSAGQRRRDPNERGVIRKLCLENRKVDAHGNDIPYDLENWSKRNADSGVLPACGSSCIRLGRVCACAEDFPSCIGSGNEDFHLLDNKLNHERALSDSITVTNIESHLYTAGCPPPDILIRTSGETRLSNFMLWQSCSYTRLSFCNALWPDFSFRHLAWIILDYQRAFPALQRQRKLQNQILDGDDL